MAAGAVTSWLVHGTAPGAAATPADLVDPVWVSMTGPGTAASALRDAGSWTTDDDVDLDGPDWWFRADLAALGEIARGSARLRLHGLATIAEVWWNGERVLASDSMFTSHALDVEVVGGDELLIVCRSLTAHLSGRRPRGRWKTRLVDVQHLRWVRTTLLGRMPTWPPRAAPVGPWRPVELVPVADRPVEVEHLAATLPDGSTDPQRGHAGRVELRARVWGPVPTAALLEVGDGPSATTAVVHVEPIDGGAVLTVTAEVASVPVWQPITHGTPHLVPVRLLLAHDGEDVRRVALGAVGFRRILADRSNGGFRLVVNGIDTFCRGACWVPLDVVRLWSSRDELRVAITRLVDAGANMIRITGTGVYEQDDLYDLCDELGLLVWHDLMLANMDLPSSDPGFLAVLRREVEQFLARMQRHPCIAVICGGSEIEQQASMMGLDAVAFPNELGREVLPAIVGRLLPDSVYVPCSPSNADREGEAGASPFPFSVSTGISHYYGVGAYLRPLDDARRSGVRFTTECLAFANVPCRESVDALLRDGERGGTSPRWKQRVPRDRGVGWDFEDVRDHYVRALFGVDPTSVRYADPDRYLDLGRAAVAIAIDASVSEWRRPGSTCDGALVFTARDLCEGPGWGVVDVHGRAKSAFHALARASAPRAVLVTDEGLNGLFAHVVNDPADRLTGSLRTRLLGHDGTEIASASVTLDVAAHAAEVHSIDRMFGSFRDLGHAFRFGPLTHDVVVVELLDDEGTLLSDHHHFPAGHARPQRDDLGLEVTASLVGRASGPGDDLLLDLTTREHAQFVSIDVPGFEPDLDWFHLAPGVQRSVRCRRLVDGARPAGEVRALNLRGARWFAAPSRADDGRGPVG